MAVTLPSDLIADVMRNADPARRQAAMTRLQTLVDPGQGSFGELVEQMNQSGPVAQQPGHKIEAFVARAREPSSDTQHGRQSDALRGFERMVLRNLFETLLPSEESGAFGGGASAGIWRSMAADQFAGVYANAGGIGIAKMLSTSTVSPAPLRAAEWPYFKLDSIRGFTGQG